ncbi:MAG: HEAT repeat protein [Myxococcota bacterium]|jgi:HEAT repeat protein
MPNTLRNVLLALLLVTLATPALAVGKTSDQRRRTLVSLLANRDARLTRSVLRTVGPDINELLINIAGHPQARPHVRMRAIAGMGYFPSPPTRGFLGSLLLERNLLGTELGTMLRRQAIRSLAVAFGGEAVDDLLSLRNDPIKEIRVSLARALGDTGSPKALTHLKSWLGLEREITVKIAIDLSIDKLQGR